MTDDWLNHLLLKAQSDEEIAFAFGFSVHAAADVFAHTYINQYAGDIFELRDEREVEVRHFVLEKYIESLTPTRENLSGQEIDWTQGLATPVSFVKDNLILDEEVARQYGRTKTCLHLWSMYQVRRAVINTDRINQDLISKITSWAAEYYKKQLELQVDLATGKTALDAAQLGLDGQMKALEVERKLYEEALRNLEKAKDFVNKYPELLTVQQTLLAEQTKLATDLAARSTKLASEVAGEIKKINDEIQSLQGKIIDLGCEFLLWPKAVEKCKEKVNGINGTISNLNIRISGYREQARIAEEAAKQAEELRDQIKKKIDQLQEEYKETVRKLNENVYQATIDATEARLKLQEKVTKEAKVALVKVEDLVKKLQEELDVIDAIIDEIKEVIDRYNLVHVLLEKWIDDIGYSVEKYVLASEEVGKTILVNGENPISFYADWFQCYGQVFVAQPKEIGIAGCIVADHLNKIKSKYEEIYNDMPELLQWMAPSKKMSELAMKELEPELKRAKINLIAFLSDRPTAEFVMMLSDPKNANREALNEIFAHDDSPKSLLTFPAVSELIDQDLHLVNDKITVDSFTPLKNAVTLSKLCLFDATQLNQMIANQLGDSKSPYYGKQVYTSTANNFCLLIGAIRNIDGNHQWQAYGLPYPRRVGNHAGPRGFNYGRNYYQNKDFGFRLYVDPYLREKVFIPLFAGSMTGVLRNRAELKWPRYQFPECAQNPYPSTQNRLGDIQKEDRLCQIVSNPTILPQLNFSNQTEYKSRYFQMEDAILGDKTWTIVGSFQTKLGAERHAQEILQQNPDIYCEVWKPANKNKYWTVMMAAGTTQERAKEAVDLAKRRAISLDAFIWSPKYPWKLAK